MRRLSSRYKRAVCGAKNPLPFGRPTKKGQGSQREKRDITGQFCRCTQSGIRINPGFLKKAAFLAGGEMLDVVAVVGVGDVVAVVFVVVVRSSRIALLSFIFVLLFCFFFCYFINNLWGESASAIVRGRRRLAPWGFFFLLLSFLGGTCDTVGVCKRCRCGK